MFSNHQAPNPPLVAVPPPAPLPPSLDFPGLVGEANPSPHDDATMRTTAAARGLGSSLTSSSDAGAVPSPLGRAENRPFDSRFTPLGVSNSASGLARPVPDTFTREYA